MEAQKILNDQSNPEERKKQSQRYHTPLLQTILQNNKTYRHARQWIRTESPEINSHIYKQLIFDKGAKNIPWKKENL